MELKNMKLYQSKEHKNLFQSIIINKTEKLLSSDEITNLAFHWSTLLYILLLDIPHLSLSLTVLILIIPLLVFDLHRQMAFSNSNIIGIVVGMRVLTLILVSTVLR